MDENKSTANKEYKNGEVFEVSEEQQKKQRTQCEWRECRKEFDQLQELIAHVNNKHIGSGKPSYFCEWKNCQRNEKPFIKRHKMCNHLRTHTGERPFICTEEGCGKKFSRPDSLNTHTKTHSNIRPYICRAKDCGKAYYHARSLKKHEKSHASTSTMAYIQYSTANNDVLYNSMPFGNFLSGRIDYMNNQLQPSSIIHSQPLPNFPHHSMVQQNIAVLQSSSSINSFYAPPSNLLSFSPAGMVEQQQQNNTHIITQQQLLDSELSISEEIYDVPEYNQSIVTLEVSLLVSLCSPVPEICSKAIRCLGALCKEHKTKDHGEIYHALCLEEPDLRSPHLFVGRKAQQKRVRKYLRMLTLPTTAHLLAWEEVWKRWRILTPTLLHYGTDIREDTMPLSTTSTSVKKIGGLVRSEKSKSTTRNLVPTSRMEVDDEKQTEWQHYTGFLAALGGSRLAADMEGLWDDQKKNRSVERIQTRPLLAERFVTELVEMCTLDNVMIREAVKSTLGNDLSASLYVILFRLMEDAIAQCFGANGEVLCTDTNTLFVEQSVLILKMILDRLTENDWLVSVDFSTLMIHFVNYIDNLPRGNYTTMRTMIMMCHLIEVLVLKKGQTVIRDDVRVKNKLLEIIMEWTSNFNLCIVNNLGAQTNNTQNIEVQRDLDQVCMKAIVALLSNLPLQTSEHSREGDRVSNKNRLFQKYFAFFTQLLDRCHREEADGYQTVSSLSSRSNNPVKKDSYWGPLRESVVTAISNLLSANVEAGLKSTLAMGYHEDPRTRTAFMQVLSNILNQGAQFDTLAENITLDRYEKLVELLVESDMEITLSLCDVCPAGDVADLAEVLLNAFESRNKVLPLLKAVIEKEVFSSEQESTLFRGTNMASRMLSMFSKNTCTEYVRTTLQTAMETINGLPQQDLTWEMDPQIETAIEQVMRNKKNVCRVAGILLDVICKSATLAPGLFRQELAFLSEAVSKRFPDASKTQVGGFVFLRLFNPAILTPESFGLILPSSKEVRKILLQATRLMQNLANNVMFGAKEPHLISLNDFITSNLYRVANFLREMAQPMKQESVPSVRLETLAQMKLHRYLSENLDKISRDLSLRKSHATSDTHRIIELKRTMESFSNLLGQLGPPPDTTKAKFSAMRNYALVNGNTHYNEFMRRNKHRDLDSIRALNLMYQGGVSRGGNPVFYFITRYLPQENFDYELAVYYMLRVMEPCLNRPFELVLDLTRFSEDCEMPIHWANQFFQLILNESNDYMIALHLFNPNFHLQRYIRKLPRVVTNRMVKRIRFSNCMVGLSQYIAPAEIHLPKETNDVGKDIGLTVMNAFLVNSYRSLIPVQIKIGTEYLQVTTTREQEILWSLNTVLNNVYSMTDLIDIYLPPIPTDKKAEEGEIHVTVNGGKSTMSLIVPNREQVYRYLLDRKRNFESNITNERHGIRPKDVPGCILNMALINLGSKDPSLRTVAYNLLCSLCVSFRLSAASQLMSAKDICIPYNDSDFIVNMSQLIASSEAHLTLEFLNECVVGFDRSSSEPERQMLTLEYIVPWLRNLTLFIYGEEATKIKELIRLLIVLTTDGSKLYEQIQRKIWKTLGEMEDIHNIMIDCLIQYSVENGAGSPQAEIVTNTIVTMSNESIRGKIIIRLRKALESTSQQAHKTVVHHPAWPRIFCLVRCMTAISFFHDGSTKAYFADCCHIVSLLASTGPTLVRSSIHGFVINTLHQFITSNLDSRDRQKLKHLMDEVGDDKYRVHFGLNKSYANAFTITDETLTDDVGTMSLTSLEIIVRLLMDTMTYSSCTIDMANAWRARWMSLVTSMIFQNNPALQPRAFMILGCLAQDEIDDDLLFQILVILGNALARFDPNSAELCVSILMCLQNIVRNLSMNSTYLKPMFWLAVAMAQMNHSLVFSHAVRLMNTVLNTLKAHGLLDRSTEKALMEARVPLESVLSRIDATAGLDFGRHFSFAIAGTLLKGYRFADARESIQKCLMIFLDMETKSSQNRIDRNRLGYFVGLLLFAARNDTLQELLILAGLSTSPGKDKFETIWGVMDIPDNVLLASMLVGILDMAEGESEKLFLYSFLSKASTPELFTLVYELLIPKMNSIMAKSESLPLIEVVKEILITACSRPTSTERANRQKIHLETIGFSAFESFTFENPSISVTRLMSDLLRIICE
ncbi:hypothetical protein G6F56_000876 [Rhizopus delemar]|nr:hypothetical protein G6F56_000876 [Rhizopus delemar]